MLLATHKSISQPTVSRVLSKQHVTKKILEVHAVEKVSLPLGHIAFDQVLSTIEPVNLASYDETSFELHMGLKRGYSICRTRAIVEVEVDNQLGKMLLLPFVFQCILDQILIMERVDV